MSEATQMTFTNAKYGEVVIERRQVVAFPNGIPGFEQCRQYGLLALEEEEPFLRLLSLDQPTVGFVLVDPVLIWQEYGPQISREDLESLAIAQPEDMAVYCIVTLRPDPREVTANLKGPIVINTRTMQGRQMILQDERYHTRHAILAARQAQT
jgi:flagellar assembly factor FliW